MEGLFCFMSNNTKFELGDNVGGLISSSKPVLKKSKEKIELNWGELSWMGIDVSGEAVFYPEKVKVVDRVLSTLKVTCNRSVVESVSKIITASIGDPTSSVQTSSFSVQSWEHGFLVSLSAFNDRAVILFSLETTNDHS